MDPRMILESMRHFLQHHSLAVQASVSPTGLPQAAVVGILVSDELEVFFDILATSRKLENLRSCRKTALVIGWDDQQTVQLEGLADEPEGPDLQRLKALYFDQFPDGKKRETWPLIAYVRVRPTWIRYSDFRGNEPMITELTRRSIKTEGSAWLEKESWLDEWCCTVPGHHFQSRFWRAPSRIQHHHFAWREAFPEPAFSGRARR